ncbi:aspartate/glutamate racemase family protein [Porticoccaceae bacterium]|nr:aspartate/glutamate racemase family protein [Porticoccaceae bacterium]
MKTIGLLGGMSWQSSLSYYRAINEGINESLGGLHSAKIILYSVNFQPIEKLQHIGDWDGAAKILIEAALNIQSGGADYLFICTNTIHKLAPQIQAAIDIPLIHIADATAETLQAKDISTVGLMGTAFTMEQEFYKGRLTDKYGIKVLTPNQPDRQVIHDVIYQELCRGEIRSKSKAEYLRIIDALQTQGAEAIILGCTEIGMLVNQCDTEVFLLDTTEIHSQKAVQLALS